MGHTDHPLRLRLLFSKLQECWLLTAHTDSLPGAALNGRKLYHPTLCLPLGQPTSSDRSIARTKAWAPCLDWTTLKGHPSFCSGHKIYWGLCCDCIRALPISLPNPASIPSPHRWCSQNYSSINCLHANLCFRVCFPGNLTYNDGWSKKAASKDGVLEQYHLLADWHREPHY